MTGNVNEAMLELHTALAARSLYPAGHPRISNGEGRARELLSQTLLKRREITIFAVEERVIFDDKVLPASPILAESLFGPLNETGVDRITFRHGIEDREIRSFLDGLTATDPAQRLPVDTPHLTFGYIRKAGYLGAEDAPSREETEAVELAGELHNIWDHIWSQQIVDAETLGDIVSCVSKAVSQSASALLPLANIKKHDEYTFVHTINVAVLSTALSEALGFHGKVAHEMSMAALLHDVGKRVIPEELLTKKGRFSDEEFRVVQEHPVAGARLLLATPGVPPLAAIVAYEHHVRADGSGYPRLPRGWKLNLASRIVQVADVFDALRTERPYRPAMPLEKIVGIMRKDVGVFFDADLLEVFLQQVVYRSVADPGS